MLVYVLTGQSNSLGTTSGEGSTEAEYAPGEEAADLLTSFFWSNVHGANSAWPPLLYGDSSGAITTLQMQQGAGLDPAFWGPEFGLARSLFEDDIVDVLIIKASRGGGGNTLWSKEAYDVDPASGHMWGHLADTTTLALTQVLDSGRTVELRGFFYLQGESNGAVEAALTDVRLEALVEDFAAHVEGLAPGATAGMQTVVGEIAASSGNAERIQTTSLQRALAEANPDIHFVDTADLPLKADGIHFGREARLEIGERFAAALEEGAEGG